jgi:hypothetical protein
LPSDRVQPVEGIVPTLYGADFYAWANEQAALLRAGDLAKADIAPIAEEIEGMGKAEKRELVSRLGGAAVAPASMVGAAAAARQWLAPEHRQ